MRNVRAKVRILLVISKYYNCKKKKILLIRNYNKFKRTGKLYSLNTVSIESKTMFLNFGSRQSPNDVVNIAIAEEEACVRIGNYFN